MVLGSERCGWCMVLSPESSFVFMFSSDISQQIFSFFSFVDLSGLKGNLCRFSPDQPNHAPRILGGLCKSEVEGVSPFVGVGVTFGCSGTGTAWKRGAGWSCHSGWFLFQWYLFHLQKIIAQLWLDTAVRSWHGWGFSDSALVILCFQGKWKCFGNLYLLQDKLGCKNLRPQPYGASYCAGSVVRVVNFKGISKNCATKNCAPLFCVPRENTAFLSLLSLPQICTMQFPFVGFY